MITATRLEPRSLSAAAQRVGGHQHDPCQLSSRPQHRENGSRRRRRRCPHGLRAHAKERGSVGLSSAEQASSSISSVGQAAGELVGSGAPISAEKTRQLELELHEHQQAVGRISGGAVVASGRARSCAAAEKRRVVHGAPGIRAAHWRRCRALEARTGFSVQQHVEEELSLPGMDAWTGDLAGQ